MSVMPSASTFRLNGWHVLAIFVAFFGVVIAVDTGFVIMSIRTFPGQVSVTPYEDGLLHDRAVAQFAAQEKLGWRATAAAEPDRIVVQLRDQAGAPLSNLVVAGDLQRPATEAGRAKVTFQQAGPGRYLAPAVSATGAWDLSVIAVDAAGHRFEAQRRLVWP